MILDELSVLNATSRVNDEFCDACGVQLASNTDTTPVACPECEEAVFCGEGCLEASDSYHPALCDRDISSIAKDASAATAADDLYSLLLLRAFAMAATREVHPLDLSEVKYIWGDYSTPAQLGAPSSTTLPFSFRSNILLPLHMLEKMDVDIFATSALYAPWVVNTLYAKFRGTASARQGRDGRPEVGAVHPLWCLANHSCDPNVRWEWDGRMRFWVREKRVRWAGREDEEPAGIAKGEEVFSHYCDIDLPVKERREWAAGALGGQCRCQRCVWEASLPA